MNSRNDTNFSDDQRYSSFHYYHSFPHEESECIFPNLEDRSHNLDSTNEAVLDSREFSNEWNFKFPSDDFSLYPGFQYSPDEFYNSWNSMIINREDPEEIQVLEEIKSHDTQNSEENITWNLAKNQNLCEDTQNNENLSSKKLPKSYEVDASGFSIKSVLQDHLLGSEDFKHECLKVKLLRPDPVENVTSILMDKTIKPIRKLFSGKKRTDSALTGLFRLLLKVPLVLLHKFTTKNYYKSSKNESWLISYIAIFKKCFLVLFPEGMEQGLLEAFITFNIMHFPQHRVELFINSLKDEAFISEEDCKRYLSLINLRRKTTKGSIKEYYQKSVGFKMVLEAIRKIINDDQDTSEEDKEKFEAWISKFVC